MRMPGRPLDQGARDSGLTAETLSDEIGAGTGKPRSRLVKGNRRGSVSGGARSQRQQRHGGWRLRGIEQRDGMALSNRGGGGHVRRRLERRGAAVRRRVHCLRRAAPAHDASTGHLFAAAACGAQGRAVQKLAGVCHLQLDEKARQQENHRECAAKDRAVDAAHAFILANAAEELRSACVIPSPAFGSGAAFRDRVSLRSASAWPVFVGAHPAWVSGGRSRR